MPASRLTAMVVLAAAALAATALPAAAEPAGFLCHADSITDPSAEPPATAIVLDGGPILLDSFGAPGVPPSGSLVCTLYVDGHVAMYATGSGTGAAYVPPTLGTGIVGEVFALCTEVVVNVSGRTQTWYPNSTGGWTQNASEQSCPTVAVGIG